VEEQQPQPDEALLQWMLVARALLLLYRLPRWESTKTEPWSQQIFEGQFMSSSQPWLAGVTPSPLFDVWAVTVLGRDGVP
jgi:hypothetical protein